MMLNVMNIHTGHAYEEDWHQVRSGKISASNFGKLIGPKSHLGEFSIGAMTYLRQIALERISGKSERVEFRSDATDYGNAHEPDALRYFTKVTGLPLLKGEERHDTHRWIAYDEDSGCTPDGLAVLSQEDMFYEEGGNTYIKVAPAEAKCPPKHFIKLHSCNTPEDVKKADKLYYWQVISQIFFCNSLVGYFIPYHPNINGQEKGKVIEFKKINLIEDFRIAKETHRHAKNMIPKIIDSLKQ